MTDTSACEEAVVKALRTVHDPEIPVNVYDLGLIYDLSFPAADAVTVRMTLTAPNCPMADVIVAQVESKLRDVEGIDAVAIELVWEPKFLWSERSAMMHLVISCAKAWREKGSPPRACELSKVKVQASR